jgi:hypothetical protein
MPLPAVDCGQEHARFVLIVFHPSPNSGRGAG